ncbi:hypothetical protein [Streptomyces sp. NPDC002587]
MVVAENWDDAALTAASRTMVLEAVDNLVKQYDCEAWARGKRGQPSASGGPCTARGDAAPLLQRG